MAGLMMAAHKPESNVKIIRYIRLKLVMTSAETLQVEAEKFALECDGWTFLESTPAYLKYGK